MSIIYGLTIKYFQFPAAQEKIDWKFCCLPFEKAENNFVSNPWKIAVKSFEALARTETKNAINVNYQINLQTVT